MGSGACPSRLCEPFCSPSRACAISVINHMCQPGRWSATDEQGWSRPTPKPLLRAGLPASRLTLHTVDICRCLLCDKS